jgi:hypothetical protein
MVVNVDEECRSITMLLCMSHLDYDTCIPACTMHGSYADDTVSFVKSDCGF